MCHNTIMLASEQETKALIQLFESGTRLTYDKGEYVIRPGEPQSGIFYIVEGRVKAGNLTKFGEENLLIIRKKGEVFPLIWAFTGQERDIIYQALTPSIILRIDRQTFLEFLKEHPQAYPPLMDMVLEMYRIHSERIINLSYSSVRERIISFLMMMSSRFGKQTKDGLLIDVPLRHQDIASSVNASRETASREMAILERKGLISNGQLYITLKDIPGLKKNL